MIITDLFVIVLSMKILLTGGTGFIGSNLIKKLLNRNNTLILIKRSSSDIWRIKEYINDIIYYDVDMMSDFSGIFKKHRPETIIHLAGIYKKNPISEQDIEDMNNTNINFPAKLLNCAVRYEVKNVINTGTFFEYDRSQGVITEESKIVPLNYYTITKIAFETILKYYTNVHNLRSATLKLFSSYGEKDNDKVIPLMIDSLLHNRILLLGNGKQHLSFTYIEDVVKAYMQAISFLESDKYKHYEVFNICDPKSYSIIDVLHRLIKISSRDGKSIQLGARSFSEREIENVYANCNKAQRILGWKPKTPLQEGLTKTYRYYKS